MYYVLYHIPYTVGICYSMYYMISIAYCRLYIICDTLYNIITLYIYNTLYCTFYSICYILHILTTCFIAYYILHILYIVMNPIMFANLTSTFLTYRWSLMRPFGNTTWTSWNACCAWKSRTAIQKVVGQGSPPHLSQSFPARKMLGWTPNRNRLKSCWIRIASFLAVEKCGQFLSC